MNKHRIGALVAAAALTLTFAGTAFAAEDPWGGQGYPPKENCEDSAPGEALWIWTGQSSTTPLLHFGGNTYPGEQQGNGNGSYHFVAPYPTSEPTGTFVEFTPGEEGVLTLSHGCPETTTTTTTSEETTEETTSEETTSEETTSSETTSKTTTPTGSTEELTPPQTDTIGQTGSSSVSTGLLLVLAGILAAVLVVVPAAARNRR